MSACNCCTEPPLIVPVLQMDPMYFYRWPEFAPDDVDNVKYFLTRTTVWEWSGVWSWDDGLGNTGSWTDSGTVTRIETFDPETGETTVVETGTHTNTFGGSSSETLYDGYWHDSGGAILYGAEFRPIFVDAPSVNTRHFLLVSETDSSTTSITEGENNYTEPYGGGSLTRESSATRTVTLTDEFTPDGWSGAWNSFPGDANAKWRWRLKHSPTPTCYLKVWLQEYSWPNHIAFLFDPPTTITDLSPYIWEGTGNPCLPDTTKRFDAVENLIYDHEEGTELYGPAQDKYMTVGILKYSYLEGYEPDISDPDNPQPNGFPDPTWAPA